MPGLIAMISVFVVVGVEMFFASKGAGHVHSADYEAFGVDGEAPHKHHGRKRSNSNARYRSSSLGSLGANGTGPGIRLANMAEQSEDTRPSVAPKKRGRMSQEDNDSDSDLEFGVDELGDSAGDSEDESRLLSRPSAHKTSHHPDSSPPGAEQTPELTEAQHKKQLLQCLLLEAGILFHSVFIGMAVSVATGTSFIVLLVAISFHQTFEGFALGSRISAIRFPERSVKPWLMALAYGTTTPIGQAIGLAIHKLYDPASQTGLLTVGFMNAISSGLLLFAGLVELLAEDFLSDESYVTLTGKRRLHACASAVAGAALMALVGAWA